MKKILLNKGYVALVDDEDYDRVRPFTWCAHQRGTKVYAMGRTGNRVESMHRFILGALPGTLVDHINGNGLDNRRANLRLATKSQNAANKGKDRDAKGSRYKGVYWHKRSKKWMAVIKQNYKPHHLGQFDSEEEAARAYDQAATRLFGDYALLNFAQQSNRRKQPRTVVIDGQAR